jgi:hypothetical protein
MNAPSTPSAPRRSLAALRCASLRFAALRCASLRRLHFWNGVRLDALSTIFSSPTFPQLEALTIEQDPHQQSESNVATQARTGVFLQQRALRSLSIQYCDDFRPVLQGAAAALAIGNALRNLIALRINTLKVDNADGSLLPLLAANCPQLHQLHLYGCHSEPPDLGPLVGLSLLPNLVDLRLQCGMDEDYLMVTRCAALRHLHLTDIKLGVLHPILCSPQLQRLEALTLGFVNVGIGKPNWPSDWSRCFTNLHTLHNLSLEAAEATDLLLAGVTAAFPSLRSLRLSQHHLGWGELAEPTLLASLLDRLPALAVTLISMPYDPTSDPHPCSPVLREWQKLQLVHPSRLVLTEAIGQDAFKLHFDSWID